MKKMYLLLSSMFTCVGVVFGADVTGTSFSWWDILKSMFINGGWLLVLYCVCRIAFWIIRKTPNKTDDVILDKYVSQAVGYALKIIPENSNVNWVKFVGNALAKFNEAYTKEQGDSPDLSTFEKAKKLIEETADNIEFKNVKEVLEQYKNNKNVA